jgi:hypothetical protein
MHVGGASTVIRAERNVMELGRLDCGFVAVLFALVCLAQPGYAAPSNSDDGTKSSATSGGRSPAPQHAGTRARKPVHVTTAADAEQAGYVHYFLLRLPDDTMEIQVGIELSDRKIAWSFPDLGVAVSPFVEAGSVKAGGKEYEVWHLYGIRPFPDDAAMNALRKELASRVNRWVESGTPYCENDGPRSQCMSCLGFVLRVLFPGRRSDFPDLPRDFWRTGYAGSYSTHDLLLYLTGMLDLPTREARVRRIAQLTLPDGLRDDLSDLVHAMSETERAPGAGTPRGSAQKRPGGPTSNVTTRPAQRKRL